MRLVFALLLAGCDTLPTPGYCDQSRPCANQNCSGDNCRFCQGDQCGHLICDQTRHACVVEWLDLGAHSGDGGMP